MRAARKPFRIETMMRGNSPVMSEGGTDGRHAEVMAELGRLKALIKPAAEISGEAIETFRRELGEAQKLKTELDSIREAIQRTAPSARITRNSVLHVAPGLA